MNRITFTCLCALLLCHFATSSTVVDYQIQRSFPRITSSINQGLYFQEEENHLVEGYGDFLSCRLTVSNFSHGISYDFCMTKQDGYKYWGSGFTVVGPKIYQILWRASIVVEMLTNLTGAKEIVAPSLGEAWGLAHNGTHFIKSNGSNALGFYNESFSLVGSLVVKHDGKIDSLAFVQREIWASLVGRMDVLRVDPWSGQVVGMVDFAGIYEGKPDDSITGLAYNRINDTFYVTGQRWPKIFEVKVLQQYQKTDSVTSQPTLPSSSMATSQPTLPSNSTATSQPTLPSNSTEIIASSATAIGDPPTQSKSVLPQAVVLVLVIVAKGLVLGGSYLGKLPVQ